MEQQKQRPGIGREAVATWLASAAVGIPVGGIAYAAGAPWWAFRAAGVAAFFATWIVVRWWRQGARAARD